MPQIRTGNTGRPHAPMGLGSMLALVVAGACCSNAARYCRVNERAVEVPAGASCHTAEGYDGSVRIELDDASGAELLRL